MFVAIRHSLYFFALATLMLNTTFTDHAGAESPRMMQAGCAAQHPGEVSCNAYIVAPNATETTWNTFPRGVTPAYLRKAYRIPDGGQGQTVAVIDAYDDPKAEADLGVYRAQFGLPPCTTANGCFRKVAQDGSKNYPPANPAWANETSLDIDMVAAICPACNILLVEANTAVLSNMALSVNLAAALHANVISNSYGGHEFPQETEVEAYYNHPGIIITASAGDAGFGAQFPASSRFVVSVGGTELRPDPTTARGYTESVWSGSGGGCSAYEPKPAWQHDTNCTKRTANDIAFDASPNSAVAVYDSYCASGSTCGWILYAGTSIGAPAVAAMYAVAGNAAHLNAAESLYTAKSANLNDITQGYNGLCTAAELCNGMIGYDAPSGNGSPEGLAAL